MREPMKTVAKFKIRPEAVRLRQAREAAGISRDQLAEKIGTHRNQIQKLEKGERELSLEWVDRLVAGIGVSKDEILLGYPVAKSVISVAEYDVRVSAGGGFHIADETKKDVWTFSRRYIADELRLPISKLVVLEVMGDSMEPTLHSGDRVLVNMADRRVSQPGIFVLWDGDGTVVKRLELVPGTAPTKLKRISDNPLHSTYEVMANETNVIGRVVWVARRM